MIHRCPQCGKELVVLSEQEIVFQLCDHYIWYSSLGSIANDEMVLERGAKFRLLKR